jgi:Fic-DOC domain mobile mystery protein B
MIVFDKNGETPLDDISGLKQKNIKSRKQLDDAEAQNISKAYLLYTLDASQVKRVVFDDRFLRRLHKEMFGDVWSWAGEYRTTQTTIGVEANKIIMAMYQMSDDLKFWAANWDYKETATKLHHTLVKIHPFPNGNGRWARLATDIWLLKNGKEPPVWGGGDTTTVGASRDEYITALKEADGGSYEELKRFIFG